MMDTFWIYPFISAYFTEILAVHLLASESMAVINQDGRDEGPGNLKARINSRYLKFVSCEILRSEFRFRFEFFI